MTALELIACFVSRQNDSEFSLPFSSRTNQTYHILCNSREMKVIVTKVHSSILRSAMHVFLSTLALARWSDG